MLQQQREGAPPHTPVKDELPAPCVEEYTAPHTHSRSLPTQNQACLSPAPTTTRPGSQEWERPDSGFDSKEELGEERQGRDEGSSPEMREISRQSAARQPILKKKRVLQHRF